MEHKIQTLAEYNYLYEQSVQHPEKFWEKIANSFYWRKPWDKTLEWEFETPKVRWFCNGKLNITENIFERHLFSHKNKPAIKNYYLRRII